MRYRPCFHTSLVFAAIMLSLLNFHCTTAQHSKENFKAIFDGNTLNDWKGDTAVWRVENKTIIGESTEQRPLTANTFLIYTGSEPGDFELKAEFRISESGNSGIQYRSEMFENLPFTLKGYQADIDGNNVYTGQNYEERGRGFLAKRSEVAVLEQGKEPNIVATIGNDDSLKNIIKKNDWNEIHIIAQGNRLRHYINGALMSDVTDNDAALRKNSGIIGLQAHAGPPMKVEYRAIRLKLQGAQ